MEKNELIKFLMKIGLTDSNYSLNDGKKNNATILENIDGLWKCYYADEKGEETLLGLSKTESEAYLFMKEKYLNDLKILGKSSF